METMNPGCVSEHQIGEGFRLLTKEEFWGVHPLDCEYWWPEKKSWHPDIARGKDVKDMAEYRWDSRLTFRTRTPPPAEPGSDLLAELAKLLG